MDLRPRQPATQAEIGAVDGFGLRDLALFESAELEFGSGFILDGFPRTLAQAEALDGMLGELGVALERCVALTVDVDELVGRLLARAEKEGRADDNEETIRTRMAVYEEQTAPLIRFYEARGLVRSINGVGKPDEVYPRVVAVLEKV